MAGVGVGVDFGTPLGSPPPTMASTVHYKFKSQKDYDAVVFDGMFISVGDLKSRIVDKKGLGRDQACELLLTNAQNDEEYSDDTTMVWKNTSVIVKRVPSLRAAAVGSEVGSNTQKKVVYVRPPEPLPNQPRVQRRVYPPTHVGTMTWSADGAASANPTTNGDAPDSSIAALVNDASAAWETEKAVASVRGGGRGGRGFDAGGRGGGRGRGDQNGPPPPGYTCFRCNVPGHWIHQCPTNGDANMDVIRMKTAYGIPQNRLDHKADGVLVAPTGESSELVADDDEFAKMMGFLTDREKAKQNPGGVEALPAPGDEDTNEIELTGGDTDPDMRSKRGERPETTAPPLPKGPPPLPKGPPPSSAMGNMGNMMNMPGMDMMMGMSGMDMMMPGMGMPGMTGMNMMGMEMPRMGMMPGMGMQGLGGGTGGGQGFDGEKPGAGGKCHTCGEFGHQMRDCPSAVCHKCGKPGHQMRECPESLCHKCGKAGHQVRDCPESSCFKCGQTGHFSRDCPNPNAAKCHRCGENGHMARDCVNPPIPREAPPRGGAPGAPPSTDNRREERSDGRDEREDRRETNRDSPRGDVRDDAREDRDGPRGDDRRGDRNEDRDSHDDRDLDARDRHRDSDGYRGGDQGPCGGRGGGRRVVVVRKRKSDDFRGRDDDRGGGRDDDRGRGRDENRGRGREDDRDGCDSREREVSRDRGRDRGPRKRVKRGRGGGGGGGGGINSRLGR